MKTIAVEEEYEKNQELKKEVVETLMSWMEKQPHLPKISELDTILFLHSCYYSQESAKRTIDNYYTCRTHCDEIFANWRPLDENLQKAMDIMFFQPLPEPADDGSKIIFFKFQDSDAGKFNMADQIKIFCMVTSLWLAREGSAPGHSCLMDISGLTTGHLLKLNPLIIKKFFYFLQLHVHTKEKSEELYKYIPKRCFPKDYGGEAPSNSELNETMKKQLTENAEYLEEIGKIHRVDEKLRPGKANNIWGLEGSFKKLDID